MKILVVLLSMAVAHGFDFTRRCLLLKDKCVTHCPRNMHAYHTRCDRDTVSQRTCTFQRQYNMGYTCGWSRCDCNANLFLNNVGDCVPSDECPIQKRTHKRKKVHRTKHRKYPQKMPSKITFRSEQDELVEERGAKDVQVVQM